MPLERLVRPRVYMQLGMVGGKVFAQERKVRQTAFVDEQAVERIAHTDTAALGIGNDALAHGPVAITVEIAMHHPGTCLYDRHLGGVAYKTYKILSSARYAEVYVVYGTEHLGGSLMGGRQQLDDVCADALLFQHTVYQCHGGTVGAVGILASLQHTGIAALEAERKDIVRHVGACLVHHAYHAEGYRHALQVQTVVEGGILQYAPQGRRQLCHMAHVGSNVGQPLRCKLQTVVEGVGTLHLRQVGGIGLKQRGGVCHYGIGHSPQHPVALVVGEQGKLCAGRLHSPEYVLHLLHALSPYVWLLLEGKDTHNYRQMQIYSINSA